MFSFQLEEKEVEKFLEWNSQHSKTCGYANGEKSVGAIGGRLTFSFTPTGLFIAVNVKCVCGESIDLTDYDGI